MSGEHHVYFRGETPLQSGQPNRSPSAIADYSRRRREWFEQRREKLRERTRTNVIDKALKRQTERCAARRSGDPSLAVGRRLQARIHADSRKPVCGRLPSVSAISKVSGQDDMRSSGFLDWSKLQNKIGKWYHGGQWYTAEELRNRLQLERQYRERSQLRKASHKTLQKLMAEARLTIQQSRALDKIGIQVVPALQVLSVSKNLTKHRQASVHEWKMSQLALDYAERDRAKRRASIRMTSVSQASGFAIDNVEPAEELQKMDLDDIDFDLGDDFVMPSVKEFNAQPADTLINILRPFSLEFLCVLKNHIKSQGMEMKNFAEPSKWKILDKAILEKKKVVDRDGDIEITNSPYNLSARELVNYRDKFGNTNQHHEVQKMNSLDSDTTKSKFKGKHVPVSKNPKANLRLNGQGKGDGKRKQRKNGRKTRSGNRKLSLIGVQMTYLT